MDENKTNENQNTQIVKYKKDIFYGLFDVEPDDILPAPVKLIQGTSDLTKFVSTDGTNAIPGQFYFYSKKLLMDDFVCYFITIFKQPDRFSNNNDLTYVGVGVLDDLKTIFQMDFRKAAIPSIKHVISLSFFNQMPIYGIKVKVSSEQRKGKKGSYYIPKITFVKVESDLNKLDELCSLSKKYSSAIVYFKKELLKGNQLDFSKSDFSQENKLEENIENVDIDEIDREMTEEKRKEMIINQSEDDDIPF